MSVGEKVRYLNVSTSDKFKYYDDMGKMYECTFLKVKMKDSNREAWLPSALVDFEYDTELIKTHRRRLCFDETSLICGFDMILNGKVLQYVVSKNIMYDFLQEEIEYSQNRINFFGNSNQFPEYNETLKSTFANYKEDRSMNITRLRIPPAVEIFEDKKYDEVYVKTRFDETKLGFATANQPMAVTQSSDLKPNPTPPMGNLNPPVELVKVPETKAEPKVEPVPTKIETSKSTDPPVVKTDNGEVISGTISKNTDKTETKPTPPVAVVTPEPKKEIEQPKEEKKEEPKELRSAPPPPMPPTDMFGGTQIKIPEGGLPKATGEKEISIGGVIVKGSAAINTSTELMIEEVVGKRNSNILNFYGPLANSKATMVSFVDINNNPINTADLMSEGKIVILDFWASWCPSCMAEMDRHQNDLIDKLGKDVVFIYVNRDKDEGTWRNMVQRKGFTKGIHVFDGNRIVGDVYYHSPVLPQKYVVYNSTVVYNSFYKSEFNMEDIIAKILERAKQ